MSIYYTYTYQHPITLSIFYVGYGKNNRSTFHLREAINHPTPEAGKHKLNTIRQLLRSNLNPIISIVDTNLSKETACELEEFLISIIGRRDLNTGPLTNCTIGGDGNREWSHAARQSASDCHKDMISAKDPVTGELFKIHKDDPRWTNGQLVGHNLGKLHKTNKDGKLFGYVQAKNKITGESVRIKKDDPRWLSGEFEGIRKGTTASLTVIAAAKARKGIPQSAEHGAKISKALTGARWIHNFSTNISKRLTNKNNNIPEGFVKVSGPHKKIIL